MGKHRSKLASSRPLLPGAGDLLGSSSASVSVGVLGSSPVSVSASVEEVLESYRAGGVLARLREDGYSNRVAQRACLEVLHASTQLEISYEAAVEWIQRQRTLAIDRPLHPLELLGFLSDIVRATVEKVLDSEGGAATQDCAGPEGVPGDATAGEAAAAASFASSCSNSSSSGNTGGYATYSSLAKRLGQQVAGLQAQMSRAMASLRQPSPSAELSTSLSAPLPPSEPAPETAVAPTAVQTASSSAAPVQCKLPHAQAGTRGTSRGYARALQRACAEHTSVDTDAIGAAASQLQLLSMLLFPGCDASGPLDHESQCPAPVAMLAEGAAGSASVTGGSAGAEGSVAGAAEAAVTAAPGVPLPPEWQAEWQRVKDEAASLRQHRDWAQHRLTQLIKRASAAETPARQEAARLATEVKMLRAERGTTAGKLQGLERSIDELKESMRPAEMQKQDAESRAAAAEAELRGAALREQELQQQLATVQKALTQERKRREATEQRARTAMAEAEEAAAAAAVAASAEIASLRSAAHVAHAEASSHGRAAALAEQEAAAAASRAAAAEERAEVALQEKDSLATELMSLQELLCKRGAEHDAQLAALQQQVAAATCEAVAACEAATAADRAASLASAAAAAAQEELLQYKMQQQQQQASTHQQLGVGVASLGPMHMGSAPPAAPPHASLWGSEAPLFNGSRLGTMVPPHPTAAAGLPLFSLGGSGNCSPYSSGTADLTHSGSGTPRTYYSSSLMGSPVRGLALAPSAPPPFPGSSGLGLADLLGARLLPDSGSIWC